MTKATDKFQDIRDAVRDLCSQFPDEYHRKIDAQRTYPEAFVDALTKAGWMAALIPQQYGGSGLGLTEATVIMEEINRAWLTRAQSEVTLASELVGKLATSRSIPDAATACQECMSRQMEMLAEDSRRMLADGEKLMRAGARLFANGSPGLST